MFYLALSLLRDTPHLYKDSRMNSFLRVERRLVTRGERLPLVCEDWMGEKPWRHVAGQSPGPARESAEVADVKTRGTGVSQ